MSEIKQNPDYGHDIQVLYLEMLLSSAETFVICQTIFDHTLFDKKLQISAQFINEFVTAHNTLPTFDIVNAATGSNLRQLDDLIPAHFDWLLENFETFIRHKALESAIVDSYDLLQSGQYGLVEEKIKSAVQKGLNRDLGTDYFFDPKARLMKIRDSNGQISTGWLALDRLLYGGFNRGELSIFCAQSGGGKSLFLANIGLNFALQGLNVVYITLELAEELVGMRMDAMLTGIETGNIYKEIDNVEYKIKNIGKKAGSIQIKYMPSGKNCNDLRSYLKEYEIKNNRKVDILLVDYLDLMMPISAKISAENLFIKDKYVSEELRNLATEQKCSLVTASQLNRSSIDELEFNHSHISGGLSKIQTADNVFGIFTTKALREHGKVEVQLLKTRNSSGVDQKIRLNMNIKSMRITNNDDDDDIDDYTIANTPVMSKSSQLLKSLQRTSVVTSEDVDVIPISKPETKADAMRQMLDNLSASSS